MRIGLGLEVIQFRLLFFYKQLLCGGFQFSVIVNMPDNAKEENGAYTKRKVISDRLFDGGKRPDF
jgi:hypothetical protein